MDSLRPECRDSTRPALPDDTVYFLVRDAVERRRQLAYGKLHDGGLDCAMGAFWRDNPNAVVHSRVIEEIATVNDSIKPSTPNAAKLRWQKVRSWLRWKVRVMALKAD
jgi:uncharacterized protein YdaU (DUF1376 family)